MHHCLGDNKEVSVTMVISVSEKVIRDELVKNVRGQMF